MGRLLFDEDEVVGPGPGPTLSVEFTTHGDGAYEIVATIMMSYEGGVEGDGEYDISVGAAAGGGTRIPNVIVDVG